MRILGILFLLIAASPTVPDAATYAVEPGEPNEVIFISKAPMETFEGKTRKISGELAVDPGNLVGDITCAFRVDMASLSTGLGLRDRHMRDNHLETKEFPQAVFEGGTVAEASGASLGVGTPVEFQLTGSFTLHGVTREITIPVEATLTAEGGIEVVARFAVILGDYKIKRPGFLMMKLAEEQQVVVTFTAVEQTGVPR